MKNLKYLFLSVTFIGLVLFIGCGEDSGTNNNTGITYTKPTINFVVGATYKYNNDSLINNNGTITVRKTRLITTDVVQNTVVIGGFTCYPIISTTRDTVPPGGIVFVDTAYVRYDASAGKFYQYGVSQYINPQQQPTWDLVADFSVPSNTEWTIGTVNYPIVLPPPYGTVNMTGPLTAKITDSTSQTTSNGENTYPCFKAVMTANLSGTTPVGNITTTIVIDYYLGINNGSNPSAPGLVRLRVNPFAFALSGTPVLYYSTFDRIMQKYTP